MNPIQMKSNGTAELCIYGELGDDIFGGITAKHIRTELKKVDAKVLNLRIDSPGGSVFEGNSILSALDEFKGRIEVDVDGLAASMASAIMCVGHVVRIAQNGFVMMHNPFANNAVGRSDDLRRTADLLDKITGGMLDRYAQKTNGKTSRDDLGKMMSAETWLSASEAVTAGLADSVSNPIRIAACADLEKIAAKLGYKLPAAFSEQQEKAWAETERRKLVAAKL